MSQTTNSQKQTQQRDAAQGGREKRPHVNTTVDRTKGSSHSTPSNSSSPSGNRLTPSSAHSSASPKASSATSADMENPVGKCAFCQILRGELSSTVIEEWDDAICFIPLDPCAPGHVLVVPKIHVKNGEEDPVVTAKTILRAMEKPHELMQNAMQHLGEQLPKETKFDYNTQFSRGENATQSVFHLHIHLVPRFTDDGLLIMWTDQTKGRFNTTGKRMIKVSSCLGKGVPDEKKCSYCKKRHMMTKEQQTKFYEHCHKAPSKLPSKAASLSN